MQTSSGLKIGCHLSISGGYLATAQTAVSIGANTFQYFSRNPRGGAARSVDLVDIASFKEYATAHDLLPVLAHAPYTLNAGSASEHTRNFAEICLKGDLQTLNLLGAGATQYTFHPGSHTGLEKQESMAHIVGILNKVIETDTQCSILLEAMSGKGSEIGASFVDLKTIIDGIAQKDAMGVCLDTCHLYAAGYDIVENLDGVLEEFDSVVGLARIRAVHLNDSMHTLGAHKDRHARIGEGTIGADAIVRLINHPTLKHLPFYLETPCELDGYAQEITFLRSNYSI